MIKVQPISFKSENSNLLQRMGQYNYQPTTPVQTNYSPPVETISPPAMNTEPTRNKEIKTLRTAAYVGSALALVSLGVTGVVALKRKKVDPSEIAEQVRRSIGDALDTKLDKIELRVGNALNDTTDKLRNITQKVDDNSTWFDRWVRTLEENNSNRVEGLERRIQENAEWQDGWIKDVERKAQEAAHGGGRVIVHDLEKNLAHVDNMRLMQNLENDGSRKILPKEVQDRIRGAAHKYIYEKQAIPKLEKDSSVWSLTAESLPEKEGGLGEVPVQMATNMTKELGIDNFLVRPINEIPGKSKIVSVDGKYKYFYDLDKPKPFEMELQKVFEYNVSAFKNGQFVHEPVEVFFGLDPRGFKRLMFKNTDYFKSEGLYKSAQTASEVERWAFFPKAVYDFAKIVADPSASTDYKIINEAIFKEIKVPKAMILNDWHAASMAGLMRIKAPMEAAMGEFSPKAAAAFENMNLMNIIHNADYQGNTWNRTSEVLNTLFDKYTFDAYELTNSGFLDDGIQKVLTVEGGSNLANIGACLATKPKPVSPTYARELASDPNRGHSLQHVFDERLKAGTMEGASNGWDRSVNEVSVEKLLGFNSAVNNDKIAILKHSIDSIEGLTESQQKDVARTMNVKLDISNFDATLLKIRELSIPKVNEVLSQLDAHNMTRLRVFKPYTNKDSIDVIMDARKHNKRMFVEYLQTMVEQNKKGKELFNLREINVTDLSKINMDDLDNTLVMDMGVRFVSQKGVDIAAQSIENYLKAFEARYPGKPKPIFVIGGKDDEFGKIKQIALDLKRKLGDSGNQVVYMDGYTPNNVFQSGSDFTLYSSHFEPDGAKWESLYKGTPVICTRVGGHVDSVQDGVNGFLSKRTVTQVGATGYPYVDTMAYDFTEAMFRASDTFYDKTAYSKMVRNAIDGDQSWLIKDKDGKIIGGALLGHLKDLGFDLADFAEIAIKEAA